VDLGMKNKDSDLIKKMEKDLQNLRDVKAQNEKYKADVEKYKKKFYDADKEKEELKNLNSQLQIDNQQLKDSNNELNKRKVELFQENMELKSKVKSGGPKEVGKLDQSALDKFEKNKKELEEEIDNLNISLKNEKDNVKSLKRERADLFEKVTVLNKRIEELETSKTSAPVAVAINSTQEKELQLKLDSMTRESKNYIAQIEQLQREL
jgi:chromosome segregation ATPase